MAAIEVSDELASQIEEVAQRAGETPDAFLREAVLARLEELEDIEVALERLKNPGRRYTLEEVGKRLGLDD